MPVKRPGKGRQSMFVTFVAHFLMFLSPLLVYKESFKAETLFELLISFFFISPGIDGTG